MKVPLQLLEPPPRASPRRIPVAHAWDAIPNQESRSRSSCLVTSCSSAEPASSRLICACRDSEYMCSCPSVTDVTEVLGQPRDAGRRHASHCSCDLERPRNAPAHLSRTTYLAAKCQPGGELSTAQQLSSANGSSLQISVPAKALPQAVHPHEPPNSGTDQQRLEPQKLCHNCSTLAISRRREQVQCSQLQLSCGVR